MTWQLAGEAQEAQLNQKRNCTELVLAGTLIKGDKVLDAAGRVQDHRLPQERQAC